MIIISAPIFVVCRRGNDSQVAVQLIRKRLSQQSPLAAVDPLISVKDLIGGLTYWSDHIDINFPKY